jgi:predicted nucleic acid-binding protein
LPITADAPRNVVVDSGPLVAWLHATDSRHGWAAEQFSRLRAPVVSCEAVLAEAAHLVRRGGGDPHAVVALVERGVVRIGISVQDQAAHLEALMRKYRGVPMSLADACLVRLSEILDGAAVMTLDADFRIYRRHRRLVIPLIAPFAG